MFSKIAFCLFGFSCILAYGHGKKVTIDFEGDIERNGFYYDHMERVRYFRTAEELLLGEISPALNQTADPLGVWLYESVGVGGCCGGQLDFTTQSNYNPGDNVEVLIRYFTNVNLSIFPDTLGSRTIITPPDVSPINWTTKIFRVNTTTSPLFRITAQLGVNQSGYFLLDKIVLGVNESVLP